MIGYKVGNREGIFMIAGDVGLLVGVPGASFASALGSILVVNEGFGGGTLVDLAVGETDLEVLGQ